MSAMSIQDLQKHHQALKALTLNANKEIFNSKNQKALDYAKNNRKMSEEVINSFKIGFIPQKISQQIEDLFSYKVIKNDCPNLTAGEIEQILLKNGVVRIFESKDGRSLFKEVFGDRMLLPFMDKDNNIIGFTSRRIDAYEKADFESPKYLNSPESDVFHKREMFFNYDNVKQLVKSKDYTVVCEGTLDAIAYYKANKIPALAGSGIALSEQQCQMIKDLGINKVVLSYDNDDAGMDAMLRNYEILQKFNIETRFIDYKNNELKDIDEIVNNQENGPKIIQNLVDTATDEIDFLFKYYKFKISHIETHNDKNDSKKITYKKESELTDLDKFNIVYDVFNKYYEVHNLNPEDKYLISKKQYGLLQNKLALYLNLSISESKDLIYSFIDLSKRKNELRIKKAKFSKENYIKPQWEVFENDDTIHQVLEIIGAEKANRRGFYKSLWNNDSNPSLSVKRGQNLWKDFSSGFGGGIYQLIGYLDITDPKNIKITDNPKQTTHSQAYNWLIKVLNSDLKQTTSTESINAYMLPDDKKQEIKTLESVFADSRLIACDNDFSDNGALKEQLKKLYPDYFALPDALQKRPPILWPTSNPNCSLPIYSTALINLSDDNKFISLNNNSKELMFFNSAKNNFHAEIYFKYPAKDFLDDDKKLEHSLFLCNNNISKQDMNKIFNGKFKTFDIKNPSDDFIKNNFELLCSYQKPIFVNGQDLYKYCAQKKLVRFTIIAQQLGKNNKTNISKEEILNILNKSSKLSSDYFTKVFLEATKGKQYPPR